jgi:hypothetical protein
MHEQALDEAQRRQSGGLFSIGDGDEPDLEWRVRESSSSYVGSEPWGINHHVWRIEQVERLACERLVIGSVELEPYEYTEEADEEGRVRLAARALISEADLAALSAMSGPMQVVRSGISDTPRRMRLDYVWGERPEGLAVALACIDAGEPRVGLHSLDRLPASDELADLVEALQAKGVLTDADLQALRERRHAARRIANIDAWQL